MGGLTWLSSYPRSGCEWVRVLVTSYLLDVPAPGIDPDAAVRVAPDLVDLFNHGRMVPLGDDRPYLAKTHFHPGVEALRPYRQATGRVVHLVRDPRGVISSHVRQRLADDERLGDEERRWLAMELIRQLAPAGRPASGSGPWSHHVLDWASPERIRRYFPNVDDICVVRFEDLRSDPAAALHTVVKFLAVGGEVDPDRVRRTVDGSTLRDILEAGLNAPPDDLVAFQDNPPPPPVVTAGADLSLMDIGEEVEAAYQHRLAEDQELAGLVRRFGYESDRPPA
jgi:hypothetical protein